jgi:GntR family transcriptional regulator, transcriptional repressor for pyruvate dehydrogenase complex
MEGKIRPQTVAETVIERVLAEISAGRLVADQKLPPQREMASQLGVSNSSIREALQSLQTMGVIEIRHGVGAFVLDQSLIRPVQKPGALSAVLTARRIEELMEARSVVEIGLARMAAERATDEQIEELGGCLVEMTRGLSQSDGRLYSEYDVRFHMLLAESSGNVPLSNFAQTLGTPLKSLIEFLPYSSAGLLHHRHIVDALSGRDPAAAARAMAGLMRHTASLLREKGYLTELSSAVLDDCLAAVEGGRDSASAAPADRAPARTRALADRRDGA